MSAMFDLEQDILKCWNVTTDLGEILDDVETGHMELPEAIQALRAYQQVYERRFSKCFQRFEAHSQEVFEMRNRLRDIEAPMDFDIPENPGKMAKKRGKKAVDQ